MKINVEIDLDWLEEDSTIDEAIKQQIINGVTDKVSKVVIEKTTQEIIGKVSKNIDILVKKTYTDILKQKISITDNYGDVIKCYGNVKEMIKEKFDKFLIEKVDSNGNASTYGDFKRIDFIVNKQIRQFGDKFTKETIELVKTHIEKVVSSGLQQQIGHKLMNVLEINKLIGIEEKAG